MLYFWYCLAIWNCLIIFIWPSLQLSLLLVFSLLLSCSLLSQQVLSIIDEPHWLKGNRSTAENTVLFILYVFLFDIRDCIVYGCSWTLFIYEAFALFFPPNLLALVCIHQSMPLDCLHGCDSRFIHSAIASFQMMYRTHMPYSSPLSLCTSMRVYVCVANKELKALSVYHRAG